MRPTSSPAWPHVRAALVLLHVVAVLAMATPVVQGGFSRRAWRDRAVQSELSIWAERLEGARPSWLGAPVTKDRLEEALWSTSVSYGRARAAITAPFSRYGAWLGTSQPWQLFVAPQVFTATLHVEVEQGGAFRTVFVDNDPAHRWLATKLEHDRVQSALFWFSWADRRRQYEAFVAWLARRAARDFEDASRIRVRYLRTRTPSPDEEKRGARHPARFDQERTVELQGHW